MSPSESAEPSAVPSSSPSASLSLEAAIARVALDIPAEQIERLDAYCRALWSWNDRLNLTRHTDYDKFAERDLVDAVQLAQLLPEGEDVLDVGSGGGVPGIVLAILRPDLDVSLCESVGKKATALGDIVEQLDLPTPVYAGRAEDILDDMRFGTLTARAVGPLAKMLGWFRPHWASIGQLLAIKGPRWVDERGEARHRGLLHGLQLRKVASYPMPGTESESVILRIWPGTEESGDERD